MRLTAAETAQVIVALSDRMIHLRESEAMILRKMEVMDAADAGLIEVYPGSFVTDSNRRDEIAAMLKFCRSQQEAVQAVQRKLDHYLLTNS